MDIMSSMYKQGDSVKLTLDCKTPLNKYKKGDIFVVEDATETTLYLINEKGPLTIHRLLSSYVEKT